LYDFQINFSTDYFETQVKEVGSDDILQSADSEEEEMTTSLKSMKGEASELRLWDSIPPSLINQTRIQQQNLYSPSVTQGSASSTAVEALSSQMVSDIIHEITRKGSNESLPQPETVFDVAKSESSSQVSTKLCCIIEFIAYQ